MESIAQVMTRGATFVSPGDSVQQAAQRMAEWNVGALPVCDGKRLVGMITDRDITIRAVAEGKLPTQACVSDVMTDQVMWCFEDQSVGEVLQQMGDQQIRRIPVVNRNMELTGIVSLGDLATRHTAQTESTLEEISSPVPPQPHPTGKHPSHH